MTQSYFRFGLNSNQAHRKHLSIAVFVPLCLSLTIENSFGKMSSGKESLQKAFGKHIITSQSLELLWVNLNWKQQQFSHFHPRILFPFLNVFFEAISLKPTALTIQLQRTASSITSNWSMYYVFMIRFLNQWEGTWCWSRDIGMGSSSAATVLHALPRFMRIRNRGLRFHDNNPTKRHLLGWFFSGKVLEMDSEYLKKHVGDALTRGLTEVVQVRPHDPIEYLAYWLQKYVDNREHAEMVLIWNFCSTCLIWFADFKCRDNCHFSYIIYPQCKRS